MDKIAIIDFGGQYTHLIARRIRDLNVFSEIYNPEEFSLDTEIKGIIFSGGPRSVNTTEAYRIDLDIANSPVPILGICYGHQLLAYMLGGQIDSGNKTEYGFTEIECETDSKIFSNLATNQQVWMSHGDHVAQLPKNLRVTARSENVKIAAFESDDGKFFGMQFHPEVTHSLSGQQMLDNFLKVCQAERSWDSQHFKELLIGKIQKQAAGDKLVLLLSGGVDSMVALRLCIEAIGNDRIHSFHVDTGFMRQHESVELAKHFKKLGFQNIEIIKAENTFLKALKGVTAPEEKRLIIGRLFVEIANEELGKLNLQQNWKLVQGTIYPDTIESGSTPKAAKIKTHHNRVGEIQKLIDAGRVIEPLADLYKDEVRALGRELGLPEHLVERHPFPGPGLAIRVICSATDKPQDNYRKETAEIRQMLHQFDLEGKVLPVRSVGVQGDFRTYHHPVVCWRNKENKDIWKHLRSASVKVVNNFKTVNRVIFSTTPVTELHMEKLYLQKQNLDELRQLDALMRELTDKIDEIWQMPVVQLPLIDKFGKRCYVIRPVVSTDAMSADFYEMAPEYMSNIICMAKQKLDVGYIFYDITTKPPGTIEWE
jgi:GMP synthase (glutamine-hydrolysing)